MKVDIYCNRSGNNYVTKKITKIKTLDLHLKEDKMSVLEPVFEVAEKNIDTVMSSANYVRVSDFGRYYYMTPVMVTGGMVELHCKVDPLMSFASYIRNTNATLKRQEHKESKFVVDEKLPISKQRYISQYNFDGTPFTQITKDNQHFVMLTTTGGK